jgi:hypothetical protein
MLTLNIQNPQVRANIIQVIKAVKKERQSVVEKRKQLVMSLNPKTGLWYCDPIEPLVIDLVIDLDLHGVSIIEKGIPFNIEKLDRSARQVISETCAILKQTLSSLHDIRELAYFELSEDGDRGHLKEAWFAVSRMEAEKLLLNTKPGTYLFRKDVFAGCLEGLLVSAKQETIRCFTLTYMDIEGQVRDKTIIQWKGHWMFYDDDPTLSGDYYLSLNDLLMSLGSVLKKPLRGYLQSSIG